MLGASSVTATASKSTTLSAQFFAPEKLQFTKKEIKWIKTMYNGGGGQVSSDSLCKLSEYNFQKR